MMDMNTIIERKVEEIRQSLSEGKRVFWGDIEIRDIAIVKTRRGIAVMINGSDIVYPSRFVLRKILVI